MLHSHSQYHCKLQISHDTLSCTTRLTFAATHNITKQADYIEIIKPLSDEEMAIALKRMEAKALKQAKEEQAAEKRLRAEAMGFAISENQVPGTKGSKGPQSTMAVKFAS